MGQIASDVQSSLSNAAQNIFGSGGHSKQQRNGDQGKEYSLNVPSDTYNFNENHDYNNGHTEDEFESKNGGSGNIIANNRPLLPMPPPSYPAQPKQQQISSFDRGNSYSGAILQSFQNAAGGNGRTQNGFGTSASSHGQLMLPSNYGGRPSGYSSQPLNDRSTPNGLPNSLNVGDRQSQQLTSEQGWITVG
ncbi:unnamed protein product [Gongylonema pulchrum]|uniref:Uncharacterized protein n=1 Tax=Gongylonema pulchrum TaxID=637853 RepID=A0A183EM72_9BILA|nr:unnamed protein product [Gongylonema pulchrum]